MLIINFRMFVFSSILQVLQLYLSQLLHLPPPHVGQTFIHWLGAEHEVLDEVDVHVVDVELVPAAPDEPLELLLEHSALLLQQPHALDGGHNLQVARVQLEVATMQ